MTWGYNRYLDIESDGHGGLFGYPPRGSKGEGHCLGKGTQERIDGVWICCRCGLTFTDDVVWEGAASQVECHHG